MISVTGRINIPVCLLSRTLIAPAEIPVGALTAAIGVPVFVYLLKKG